jgi:WD40 repeat protein
LKGALLGHTGGSFFVRFSPDGKTLASGGADYKLKIWDVESGSLLREVLLDGDVVDIDFTPDGSIIAAQSAGFAGQYGQQTYLIQAATGAILRTLPGSTYGSTTVDISPKGNLVLQGISEYVSGPGWVGKLRFYRVFDGALVQEYVDNRLSQRGIQDATFGPDGTKFAYAYSSRLILASAPSFQQRR